MHLAIGRTYAAMICCEKLKTLPETSDEKTKEVYQKKFTVFSKIFTLHSYHFLSRFWGNQATNW